LTGTHLLFVIALAATLCVTLARGGRDERTAAVALLVATVLTPIAITHGYSSPEMGVVVVDMALFGILAMIALRSSSFWPMWAAGFQLCALAVHLAAAQMPQMMPAAYAETLVIWSYPVLAALGFGTWFEAGKRHGQS
jgi:hypothetical protein